MRDLTVEDHQMKYIVKMFGDFVNHMSYDSDGKLSDAFVEEFFQTHRYLQGEMLWFIYTILGKIGKKANDPMWTDDRNKFWISWAKYANKVNSRGEIYV